MVACVGGTSRSIYLLSTSGSTSGSVVRPRSFRSKIRFFFFPNRVVSPIVRVCCCCCFITESFAEKTPRPKELVLHKQTNVVCLLLHSTIEHNPRIVVAHRSLDNNTHRPNHRVVFTAAGVPMRSMTKSYVEVGRDITQQHHDGLFGISATSCVRKKIISSRKVRHLVQKEGSHITVHLRPRRKSQSSNGTFQHQSDNMRMRICSLSAMCSACMQNWISPRCRS